MAKQIKLGITIVIPTYQREHILVESLKGLLSLPVLADEILVVDQTEHHEDETDRTLSKLHASGSIDWVRMQPPSITAAMNLGLRRSSQSIVLFLDDDIIPNSDLVKQHFRVHESNPGIWVTVGQVIQPWQKPEPMVPTRRLTGLKKDFDFPFHSTLDAAVENVMAGNLCVNRARAISIGGFDENFAGAAYRFETDFARRIIRAGGKIRFLGSAGINHLRAETGGTRSMGNHLASASPMHGFGDYYYAFKNGRSFEAWTYSLSRMFREVRTRFHLTHPWYIPVKLLGEVRALIMAKRKIRQGPKLLKTEIPV